MFEPPVQSQSHVYEETKANSGSATPPVQVQSQAMADDDFDDFVDSSPVQPHGATQPAQPPLTEEERQRIEMEERIRRYEMMSSVFEDVLVEETAPPVTAPPPKPSKTQAEALGQPQNQREVKAGNAASVDQPKTATQADSWNNFDFAQEISKPDVDLLSSDFPTSFQPKVETKQAADDDDFGDFEDATPDNNQEANLPNDDPFASEVLQQPAAKNEDFPSFFDSSITPRVFEEEKSDIRMSFPSEEMWSSNFGSNSKQKVAEDEKPWKTGFELSPPKTNQKSFPTTIDEEKDDGFDDILKLKNDATKPINDDSFDDFEDAQPQNQEPEPEPKPTEKRKLPLPLKSTQSKPSPEDKWGSFKFDHSASQPANETKNDLWTSELADKNMSDFKQTSNPIDELDDPFASALIEDQVNDPPKNVDSARSKESVLSLIHI